MIRVFLTVSLAVSACGGILALAQPASAETVIAGTVKSKDGRPLPGLALLER